MRVLVVTQYYWPEHFRITDLAEGLVERGHEVDVLTGSPNYPGGKFFEGYGWINPREHHMGVRITRVPMVPRGEGRALGLALNYISYFASACLIGPVLCPEAYDAILVCQLSPATVGLPGALFRFLKRAPMVFWILDLWPESLTAAGGIHNRAVLKTADAMMRFIYQRCDHILCSSPGFPANLRSRGVPDNRMEYFPNWVEPVPVSTALPPVELPPGFRIIFAGNLGESQDLGTILSAADHLREYPKIKWIILGTGRQRDWLDAEIKQRGLDHLVFALGRFPPEAMPTFFQQADALLVTLKSDPIFALTIPGKVPSYMACGRPLLAALDGVGANLIEEAGAGLAVPAGDAQGLARIALELSQMSAEQRATLGQRAKNFCDANFDRNRLLDALERTLLELSRAHHRGENHGRL